jgi:hypothetical protein
LPTTCSFVTRLQGTPSKNPISTWVHLLQLFTVDRAERSAISRIRPIVS